MLLLGVPQDHWVLRSQCLVTTKHNYQAMSPRRYCMLIIPLTQSVLAHKSRASHSVSPAFNAVYSEALSLVEKETMVLPFTTPTGHVHILRHLNPDIVYLQESLAGDNGDVITHLQTWLRQDVVVVVGADGGHGGLADSESEAEAAPKKEQWWEKEDRVGRGRGVVVVEGVRVGDDWKRRVDNRE